MIYTITVLNEQSQPVPGAKVAFGATDGYGSLNLITDAGGKVYINDSTTGNLSGVSVAFTVMSPGYKTETWHNEQGLPSNSITVVLEKSTMQAAAIPFALGALLLLVAAGNDKNKRKGVAGFDFKNDVMPYVVPAAVVIGGFIVYNKIFGQSDQDKNRDAALDADIANSGAGRMSDTEIAATANQLVEDLTYSHPFGDGDQQLDAAHQLTKPGTTNDLLRLIKQYGKHAITYLGIPSGTFTLEETVTRKLDADIIDEINKYYSAQGINFKF